MKKRALTPGTVVVAHACPRFRASMRAELERRSHVVVECSDGLELVRMINRHLASKCEGLDVLVGDVVLPGYRPTEVMACLRWLGASFPTILTGVDEPLSLRSRHAGVRAAFPADADVTLLAEAVEAVLSVHRAWDEAWERSAEHDASSRHEARLEARLETEPAMSDAAS